MNGLALRVNKIIPISMVDGPGARFVVFTQGCNMRCPTCHNPQTRGICDLCGLCINTCEHQALAFNEPKTAVRKDQTRCVHCGECTAKCPRSADPQARMMTVPEILKILRKTRPFISGITVSGGEALMQTASLWELFSQIKADRDLCGITTFIDTNGAFEPSTVASLLAVTDGFMFDVKSFNDNGHKAHTGFELASILDNLKFLYHHGKLYEIRILIIAGFNDNKTELERCAHYLRSLDKSLRIRFLAFRKHGLNRSEEERYREPTNQQMESFVQLFREVGFEYVELAVCD